MAINVSPSTNVKSIPGIPVCLEATSVLVLPQEDERCINLLGSGTNWTFSSSSCVWTRTGGALGSAVADTIVEGTIENKQPFYIYGGNFTFNTPASPNRNYHSFIGVIDITSTCASGKPCFYGWAVTKYCFNKSTTTCKAQNTDDAAGNWKAHVIAGDQYIYPLPAGINFHEEFRLRSDGIYLNWDWKTSGSWRLSVYRTLLPSFGRFKFFLNSAYNNNQWSNVRTFKGTYQGKVALSWSAPDGGTITGSGDVRCFTAGTSGSYRVCIDSDFDTEVCIPVTVDPLYLLPDNESDWNICVFAGDILHLDSNGGLNGTLTATSGIVIDALTWQAPATQPPAGQEPVLTYTLGASSVSHTVNVINRPEVLNVVGNTITGLLPGETFQLLSNYSYPDIIWENIGDVQLVSDTGLLAIPNRLNDPCFGALDTYIRARLVGVSGYVCNNLDTTAEGVTIDFRVIVDPVYPTPAFGGAEPIKWLPQTPEFKTLITEFEGACDETHLRNRVPTHRWRVSYNGLNYNPEAPCFPSPCCDEPTGFVGGFGPEFQSAKRLDDFWMLVGGTSGYFTMIDHKTGETWQRVRFDEQMGRDHVNWNTIQSREVSLIWRPCCASGPIGGICTHKTAITDFQPPTTPKKFRAYSTSTSQIVVQWEASIDNIGVKGYQLEIDGTIVNLDNVTIYYHKNLVNGSLHNYRLRAIDFQGNFSVWVSDSATVGVIDTTNPSIPANLTAVAQSDTAILVTWDASTDDTRVLGYKLLVDGVTIDMYDGLSYLHEGLVPDSPHSYFIRAYDEVGNHSAWSAEVTESATIANIVMFGTDVVKFGDETVIF